MDILSLIALAGLEIPLEIPTVDPAAREALSAYNRVPLLHHMVWTIHDHRYLRYSWLRADKSNPNELLRALKDGDAIFFHSSRSLVGKIVRVVTRCYWEHVAFYVGSGAIIHGTLQGWKRENVLPRFMDKDTTVAILRHPDLSTTKLAELRANLEDRIGKGYNFAGIGIEFWRTLTGKKGHGLLTPITISVNLLLCSIILFVTAWRPELRRLQLVLLLATGPYMFDTIYHWLAYRTDLVTLLGGKRGESRD